MLFLEILHLTQIYLFLYLRQVGIQELAVLVVNQVFQVYQALAVSMANQVIQVKMAYQVIQVLVAGQVRLAFQAYQATVDGVANQDLVVK